MQTSLNGINNRAKQSSRHKFGGLYRLLNLKNLRWAFSKLNKRSCVGVDGKDWKSYETNLDENLKDLVSRLKGKKYRTKLIRRHYIPKGSGKLRPLGIPVLEDKIVQYACSKILESIYEADFKDFSYGYRPGTGAHNAVRRISYETKERPHNWVVEADIKGFFDNIDHDWLIKMLSHRIEDKALLGLINKWLKAGILDKGKVTLPKSGTPQGGVISPILANIYLHYVLDLWFDRVVRKHCKGSVGIVRYADDFVCFFQKKEDAESFYKVLPKRLGKFGLALAPEKTALFQFSKFKPKHGGSFDFLGFEFRWIMNRGRYSQLKIRTAPKRLRRSIADFKEWIKKCRNLVKVSQLLKTASAKLRGHYNYYGIKGNYESLGQYYYYITGALFKWLNRRSQKKSYNWANFKMLLKHCFVPKPRVKHFV